MSISGAMSIAIRALLATQGAMEITAHNMANVNTEGYSRQEMELLAAPTYVTTYGEIGTGVQAGQIIRAHDESLTRNLIDQSSLLAKYETEKTFIWNIETIFNESLDQGLNAALSDFWNAWQEVSNNPEGSAERISLLEKSEALANDILNVRSQLDYVKSDLNLSIEEAVTEANLIIQEIAALNADIARIETGNSNANDLRDKRELLLKDLSGLLDITYHEESINGHVYVLTPKGYPLIEETSYWSLATTKDASGDTQINWVRENGALVDISDTVNEGKLGGLIDLQQNIISDFYAQFDQVVSTLIKEVNRQHAQGAGLTAMTEAAGSYEVSDFARLETTLHGDDNDLVFTARNPGATGDDITITYLDPGLANRDLSITVNGNDITISLQTNALGQVSSTASEIVDFIRNDAGAIDARALIQVSLGEGQNGQGMVMAMEQQNLNRELGNILDFGDDITSGTFDLIIYDPEGLAAFSTISVNPTDTREDILAQFGQDFGQGIAHVSASIHTSAQGKDYLKIETEDGYSMAFANDTASALMALGINTFFTGYDSATIGLNANVMDNMQNIAAGVIDPDGRIQKGSNANSLELADLKDRTFSFSSGDLTVNEAYNTLASDIGSTAYTIYRNTEFTETLVSQLQLQRDSTAGVNMDEELTNMIKYQYAYMAAAKIITASDEMLKTVVSVI